MAGSHHLVDGTEHSVLRTYSLGPQSFILSLSAPTSARSPCITRDASDDVATAAAAAASRSPADRQASWGRKIFVFCSL